MKSKDQTLLEAAYKKINETHEPEYSMYSGDPQYVIFLDDIESHVGKLRAAIEKNGMSFKTAHVARQNDAANYGYPIEKSDREEKQKYVVFYEPQDFTKPALILV